MSRGDGAGPLCETAASSAKTPDGSQEEGSDALLPLPVLWLDQLQRSTELRAYVRLQVAGEEVAARQASVNWIESASHRGPARAQLAELELAN